MKRSVLIIMTLLAFSSIAYSQKDSSASFRLADCEYLKSFGNECDIFTNKDYNSLIDIDRYNLTDIFLIKPSIAYKVNQCKDIVSRCTKIYVACSIFHKNGKCRLQNIEIRTYNNQELLNDSELTNQILAIIKGVNVEALKLATGKDFISFGFVLYKK